MIIAETCQNHNGNREILKEMINTAAECGADYVKIQSIRSKELTYRERFEKGFIDHNGVQLSIKRPYKTELDRLSELDLSLEDEEWFVESCKAAGIKSMTTVFTRKAAYEIKDLGFDAVKIASYDCASFPLLTDVKQWWSTIIVSTGATYNNEVEEAAKILKNTEFVLLHCVTIYPTPITQCNLARMDWLLQFTDQVGWSDHTLVSKDGIWASKIALALGAKWIERHFTILNEDKTKDGPVSITPVMLRELKEFANRPESERFDIIKREYPAWEQLLGQPNRKLSHEEILNRDYYRGRFASKFDGKVLFNWEEKEPFSA
jgi:N,N'-diacetyllegionaminate synthase|tara:strand:- start:4541 stop:5497 length:957 start_codon:yes stop_codon:yes gene_type:complete